MYRVFRFTAYPNYWPSESTVYVDSAPGTVEEYVTDKLGTPKLVGNYIGTVTYTNFAQFPTTGKLNRLYIDGATNTLYRWSGSSYVALGGSSDGKMLYGTTSGTDTYTSTIVGPTAYTAGDTYLIKFLTENTGASTININSLGAKNLYKNVDIPLTSGDIVAGQELIIGYDGTNFQVFGITPNQMFAYVTNAEASTITRGQVVYAFGAQGDRMTVKLASNTGDATSAKTLGLVFSSSIAANGKGFIITQGVINGLNLGGSYVAGDTLYLGATAGTYTRTKPHAPNHLVYLGVVERANAGNGQVYVKVQNGYELTEIHDVDLVTSSPAASHVLYYTGTLWRSASIDTVLGYTPYNSSNPAGYITTAALSGYATELWVTNQGYQTAAQVTAAISSGLTGYATQAWVTSQGYLTGITSGMISSALGYTPYSNANPSAYQTSTQVNAAISSALGSYIPTSAIGASNGVAPLSSGLIPSQYLPSYVDDVLEFSSLASFPVTGEGGKIYVDLSTNLTYRWGGSSYIEVSSASAGVSEIDAIAYALIFG